MTRHGLTDWPRSRLLAAPPPGRETLDGCSGLRTAIARAERE